MRDVSYDDRALYGASDALQPHIPQTPNKGVEIPLELFEIVSYASPEKDDAVMNGILDLLADV